MKKFGIETWAGIMTIMSVVGLVCILGFAKFDQQKNITLIVTEYEANVILKGLGKLPLEEAGQTYNTVFKQAAAQLNPPAPDTALPKKKKN